MSITLNSIQPTLHELKLRLKELYGDHKNNTVSGKLSALALRGKRAREFIPFNLFLV